MSPFILSARNVIQLANTNFNIKYLSYMTNINNVEKQPNHNINKLILDVC